MTRNTLFSPFAVGMHAVELVVQILNRHPEIQTITLMSYRVARGLQERLPTPQAATEDPIFAEALSAARERGVPLWIALMNAYLRSRTAGTELIAAALVHDKSDEQEFQLTADEVSSERLHGLIAKLDPDFALGLSSVVVLRDGTRLHIPMIDLTCEKSDENVETLIRVFQNIGQKQGVLLDSGRSYHYYGLDLLEEKEWLAFMGRSLLLTPLVDTRYIAHRLIDDYGRLRVSSSRNKPNMPKVVVSW